MLSNAYSFGQCLVEVSLARFALHRMCSDPMVFPCFVYSDCIVSLQWTFPPVCSGIHRYTIACNSSGPFYDRLVMAFRAAPAFSPVTRVLSGPQPVEPCQCLKHGDDNEISRVVSVFLCLSHSSHIAAGVDDVDDNNEKDEHKDEHDDDNDYEEKEEEKEKVGL